MNDRQRELARIRRARRRARLKEEGTSVTVTLTKQEEAMLQELCRVRRLDERLIQRTNFFPAAAYPQLAAVAGAEGTAGKMPGLRKAESGGGARVNGKAKPLTAGLPSKPMN
ncbi:hypothetical protein [Klebsiella pneumoniae]|uniref:hypothetical protein n=1 Tax=Klebsiella pneumoniae TaxID=573 RepID=UPI001E4277A8|nr:hypothetical protein [Klebsiella pneumoniae]